MTIQEMHYHIDQGLQKNASFVYSNFDPEELDAFINKMILRFIKDRFDRTDQYELGFEAVQKRLDDIRQVVESHSHTFEEPGTGDSDVPLPDDYMFYIPGGSCTLGYDDCMRSPDDDASYTAHLRLVPHDKYMSMSRDPFSRSSPETGLLCTITGDNMNVYGDKKSILKGLSFTYIRKPVEVDVNLDKGCELAEHTHDEIVDLTVQHILEVIESTRYQSNSAQASKME